MYDHNPPVLSIEQLQNATLIEIAQAQYQFIVASVSLGFALLFFLALFKLAIWFLPSFWHRNKDGL